MKVETDLTRWNRAGLKGFRYIDGNAAIYLEKIQQVLRTRFPDWESLKQTTPVNITELEDEDQQYLEQAINQYHKQTHDWGLEIIRAFARATHVVTEHINAYANEGYLNTATQWEHVRQLVQMLDYKPAPPSSASTLLAIEVKAEQRGTINTGFQIKYTPPEGGESVIFETLDDVEVDERLNELHLPGWNCSRESFNPFLCGNTGGDSAWNKGDIEDLSVGDIAILIETTAAGTGEYGWPTSISHANNQTGQICIGPDPLNTRSIKGRARLLTTVDKIYVPRLNGDDVITVDRSHGLVEHDVIAWQSAGQWILDSVKQVEEQRFKLNASSLPQVYYPLFKVARISFDHDGILRIPLVTEFVYRYSHADGFVDANSLFINEDFNGGGVATARKLNTTLPVAASVREVYVLLSGTENIGTVSAVGYTEYVIDGKPGKLTSNDWVVGEGINTDGGAARWAMQVERIDEYEDHFRLSLQGISGEALLEEAAAQSLATQLAQVEIALDQDVFETLQLDDLLSGRVNGYPVSAIQGVGATTPPGGRRSYSDRLNGVSIYSIADLAASNMDQPISGISRTWWREFIIKAQSVVSFSPVAVPTLALRSYRLRDIREMRSLRLSFAPLGISELLLQHGQSALENIAELKRIYGPFKDVIFPEGHDINPASLNVSTGSLTLEVEQMPDSLKPGRSLLLEQKRGESYSKPREVIIESITDKTIKLVYPLLEGDGFTLGNTVIRGNVVLAGHGETADEKILGSGDATALNQSFDLNVQDISFVADSTMPSGVRADINLIVDGQVWKQVGSLRDSEPTDPHYTVRMNEEGDIRIEFGDGLGHGRRLPSGENNIRVSYRVGVGLLGNVPSGGLQKPVKPHKLVKSIRQPIPATGGGDIEAVASLRQNAPASLLTLERAVSLADFANLSVSQSGIWQARAFKGSNAMGRQESVQVVIVPAGGAELDEQLSSVVPDYVLEQQRDFLIHHSLPGVAVTVSPFEPILVDLVIRARVKYEQFDPDEVKLAIFNHLIAAFSLEARQLGQPLYRSELFKIVESITGVENSVCELKFYDRDGLVMPMQERPASVNWEMVGNGRVIRFIKPHDWQVVYVDKQISVLDITTPEYEL